MKTTKIIMISLLLFRGCEFDPGYGAQQISDDDAVKIIVGEASGSSFEMMVAVGEVIRHNPRLNAYYGLNAVHSFNESTATWRQARIAWQASANSNLTKGSNHFDYYSHTCEPKSVIDDIIFSKC